MRTRTAPWDYHSRRDAYLENYENRERRTAQIIGAKFRFGALLDGLREIDPDWEAWYDSDAIPERLDWLNIAPVLETIRKRISEVKAALKYQRELEADRQMEIEQARRPF